MKLRHLINLLSEIESDVAVCNRCGMCQAVCPVFSETGRESDVARGKIALIDAIRSSLLNEPAKVLQRLNHCLLCGSCEASCSRNVHLVELFIRSRMIITGYSGLSPVKKFIFRTLISNPRLFNAAFRRLAHCQFLFAKKERNGNASVTIRSFVPFIKGRHIKPLAHTSFRERVARKEPAFQNKGGKRVVFYTGCLIDKFFPETGMACLNLLVHYGMDVVLLEQDICCGIPAASSGDSVAFETLVNQNLHQLKTLEYDYIVTACATCAFTLKKVWKLGCNTLDAGDQQACQTISEKTRDIIEFLVSETPVMEDCKKANPVSPLVVTWHDPCHLKKSLGVYREPRQLLSALPGIEFRDMADADRCCGGGGSFCLEHAEVSSAIGSSKMDHIRSVEADVLLTGCPSCMLQFIDGIARSDKEVSVKHLVELLEAVLLPT